MPEELIGKFMDERIKKTGLMLYELISGETVSVFDKKYWTGRVLEWCMKDEAFKVEMFRFVDVFPYLSRAESVARHLREYFCRPGLDFPLALQWGIKSLAPSTAAAKLIARSISKNISAMGRQFIVGENPAEALPVLEDIRGKGIAFTADLLGEAVVSEKEASEFCGRYLAFLDSLAEAQKHWLPLGGGTGDLDWGHSPKINLSIKPSALYSQLNARSFEHSVEAAKERLQPIFAKAVEIGAFVLLDMEHRALKNLTLALYRSILEEPAFRGYPHTGIAIQAYLRDSETDTTELMRWAEKRDQPVTIRLVKGAYWDAEVIWARQNNWPVPVFANKCETDANFEKITRNILKSRRLVSLACASHNIRSIACAMETARELEVPPERLEFQILYGMAEPVRNGLARAGLPLRLYTPIGELIPGMAYLVRRLLENTSNESFLRRSFAESVPKEELLRNPLELCELERPSRSRLEEPARKSSPGAFANEPPLDWTLADCRKNFAAALKNIRKKFPFSVPLVIGLEAIDTSLRIESTDPNAPRRLVGTVSSAGVAEAGKAVEAACAAFPAWRDTTGEKRAEYLFKAAAATRKRRFELAALQVYEAGKTWNEADGDVCEAIDFLEYYGREMLRLAVPRRMGRAPGELSNLSYEPRGAGAIIAPWNFPLAISAGMTSAAIVTGNTVIYKPSSFTPVTGYMLYRIFEEAGLPAGVLNYVPGAGSEIGDYLVSHKDLLFVAFTGSKEVGLRIMELAAKTPEGAAGVKRVVAELGGKNAIIVDADADLDETVVQVLQSAFCYQGQKCSACSRLIVLEENYEKLIRRLKEAALSLQLGNPEDSRTFMGAVISAGARKKIEEYIAIGKKEGEVLVERTFPAGAGHLAPLMIFTGIQPGHRLAREEIFGPLLSVIRVRDIGEAIAVANGTDYALTGGLFSRSPENIARVKREFRVGNLYINRGCTGALVERHPFGGFKMSGIGSKAGGPDYLMQFMVPRNVVENTLRRGFSPDREPGPRPD